MEASVELDRIAASAAFAKAARLSAMLAYIVKHSLEKRADELTEQQIGIHVFGRVAGFDSSEDTIVRGTARLLRQRLELYYSDEGRFDPIRITIPKGRYVAQFEKAVPPQTVDAAPAHSIPVRQQSAAWPLTAKLLLGSLLVCNLALGGIWLRSQKRGSAPTLTGPQKLWSLLFTPGRKTLLVPGDAALDVFVAWEERPVSLADYTNQSYVTESRFSHPPHENDVPLAARSVTPMADLRLISELARVPEHMGRPDLEPWTEIRYARDVAVGDSHDNNLILIGTETFNPWVMLYKNSMDFYVTRDLNTGTYEVQNRAPRAGEQTHYDYVRGGTPAQSIAYSHLALLDNSQGAGKVLIVEGTSMGTTYAALAFLTQKALWGHVLNAATDHDGHLHNFEVLLGGDFIRGGLTNSRIVAVHVH
jgi:hypothetical protein